MLGQLRRIGESELAGQNLILAAMVTVGVLFLAIVVITPLDLVSQALFAVLTVLAMLVIRGQPSRGVTLILITLSIAVSTRYIWWRYTETLQFSSEIEAFLGIGLVLAETYAWLVLVLGYTQPVLLYLPGTPGIPAARCVATVGAAAARRAEPVGKGSVRPVKAD